jgi:dihydroorotase
LKIRNFGPGPSGEEVCRVHLRTQTVVGATILRTNKAFTKNVLREIMPNASLIQAPFPSARDYMAYAKTVKLSKNKKKQKKWVYLGTVFTRWLLTILGG